MALFSRRHSGPTVRGRAYVVPTSTGNLGSGLDGNFNNFTSKSRATSVTRLELRSVEDGGAIPGGSERVKCELPNWLRLVMHDAGSNTGQHAHLPAELTVPVLVDQATREIVELDVEGAAAELESYREIGTREWKETEAVGAPVRNLVKLPGTVRREVPGLLREWRGGLKDLRDDLKPGAPMRDQPLSPKVLEQQRRTATALRYALEKDPKQRQKVRESVEQGAESMAKGVAAGSYPSHDFAAWVVFQETSGVLSAEEATQLRQTAGIPLDGSPPPPRPA